jgi:adenylate cyclase
VNAAPGAIAFTDIVGFTEFTAERGDADALAVLDLQDQIVRDTLPPGARVVKELGDGLMLWFPDAVTALGTCLDLHERLEEAASDTAPLWVRMGMHWGCPTSRGDDLIGNDVNLAARIVDMAGPGELLVSEHVRTQITDGRDDLRFEELGPVVMKGIPEPVGLFRASRD